MGGWRREFWRYIVTAGGKLGHEFVTAAQEVLS